MKKIIFAFILAFGYFALISPYLYAKDMRASVIEAEKKKQMMLQKARMEKQEALREAQKSRQEILSHRKSLEEAILKLKNKNRALEDENLRLVDELGALKVKEEELNAQLKDIEGDIKELAGFVRVNARDLDSLLNQSLESAFVKGRSLKLKPILEETGFPGMDDIKAMTELFFGEIEKSGEVRIQKGSFVDRSGRDATGDILVLGNFTAAYRKGDETGFLICSDKSQTLFALSKLPDMRTVKKINDYMDGKSISVPMDISKGAALRQLTHRLSLTEQIPKGGPIVWPILAIGVIACLIILERSFYLFAKSINADRFSDNITQYARKNEWDKCESLCKSKIKKPLARVLLAGLKARTMARHDIENVLQETILNEIPRLERFLSTLGMLAAIAPLLGLLGTVTGMINTFHVITYFGAGDPRMMSGGISEALITTMLGLSVAIPIMLCHTLLSRKVETMIARMEEKSVTLVNTIFTVSGDL